MIWQILLGVTALVLLLHWGSRNAVWGAATLGLIIGVLVAVFSSGFDWWIVGKTVVVATPIGVVLEWAPRLMNKKNQ